ncbi:isopentenyl-diphosphate Delta-isomerase [Cryobacterium psychrophilum]|uniref:Isopentenyl-diphosphate Delta-isomerase n=1 Tax=Cryobacterium psychrophilum TaxID=41988 RepID=A0A4Y8KR78_9MICO|nr:isopentenyl-diphosphate Delta-isomerase [Cryobacterium psychrophilum]TFD81779.1 isopentenyl-diphosphate Delta-isomerase [Cryobacterium psychrophilum]
MTEVEEVVLLNADGTPVGTAPKATVHGFDTPLHLAFSCHVLNDAGEVLVTRRALTKRAWPGVWSNSFCGHPQPAELSLAAVHRRADYELGLQLSRVELALPDFRYRATDSSGIVENEVCPVYVAWTPGPVQAHPDEVMDHAWVDAVGLGQSIRLAPWAFSPWLVLQAQVLPLLGGTSALREDVLR